MLTCYKTPYLLNKTINDYCKHSVNESIKRITDRYNLETNKVNIINPFDEEDDNKHRTNIYSILAFLSISTLVLFFYKRLK